MLQVGNMVARIYLELRFTFDTFLSVFCLFLSVLKICLRGLVCLLKKRD